MLKNILDTKISVVQIVVWIIGLVSLTFSVSSAYGEQRQKLLFLSERQTSIELSIERIQEQQHKQSEALIRIESKMDKRFK